jgi:hypothetical protein
LFASGLFVLEKGHLMNKACMVLLAILLFGSAFADAAPLSPADFSSCAEVQGAVRAGSLYQIRLTEETLANVRARFEDLRVFDGSNTEVPFVVIGNAPPHESIETYPLEITGYERDASTAVITMRLPEKHRPISIVDLETADRDFKKRVSLSGSSDGRTWQPLVEDSIYDFSSQVDVRKTRIEFPGTDARYFRLAIADLAPPVETLPSIRLKYDGLDFAVNGAQKKELRVRMVRGSTGTPAEKRPVYDQRTVQSTGQTQDKEGNTVIVVPAGLPLRRLTLDVTNPYYYRTIQLHGSDTGKDGSYQLITSQVIYRFPLSSERREERDVLEANVPKKAYYKVVVVNRSNPPLEIKGITLSWIQQNLYFIALKDGERYSLCFGNRSVRRPDYDITNFVNQNTLSQHTYAALRLAPLRAESGSRVTLGDRFAGMEKLLLRTVVVLLVIGLGFWLYSLLKKTPEK